MKKSLVELYALVMCCIAVICTFVTVCIMINNLLTIFVPGFILDSHERKKLSSNEIFWKEDQNHSNKDVKKRPEESVLTQMRKEEILTVTKAKIDSEFESFVRTGVVFILGIIILLSHIILVKNERNRNDI